MFHVKHGGQRRFRAGALGTTRMMAHRRIDAFGVSGIPEAVEAPVLGVSMPRCLERCANGQREGLLPASSTGFYRPMQDKCARSPRHDAQRVDGLSDYDTQTWSVYVEGWTMAGFVAS